MHKVAIFIAVGCAAALTHLAVAAVAVELLRLQPLAANIVGFCVAFFVSFAGHARWTFPLARERFVSARNRFFVVALTGFLINQAAYAEALHFFGPRYYLPLLAIVLAGVAISTFFLSKLWAFAHPQ
jgi:putative flippase GtrA